MIVLTTLALLYSCRCLRHEMSSPAKENSVRLSKLLHWRKYSFGCQRLSIYLERDVGGQTKLDMNVGGSTIISCIDDPYPNLFPLRNMLHFTLLFCEFRLKSGSIGTCPSRNGLRKADLIYCWCIKLKCPATWCIKLDKIGLFSRSKLLHYKQTFTT